jgi:hypothetical protein
MLIVEDSPLLDVEIITHVRKAERDPAWWQALPGESLEDRLNARVDREKAKKRVPKLSRS